MTANPTLQPEPAPNYTMPCRRCGGRFLEMKDLLFHPCQQPAKRPPARPRRQKSRKNRAGATHGY